MGKHIIPIEQGGETVYYNIHYL